MIDHAVLLGSNKSATGKVVTITTTVAVAAGDTIVLVASGDSGRELLDPTVPVTDSAGNTYTVGEDSVTAADPKAALQVHRKITAAALPPGSTITATWALNGKHQLAAFGIPGGVTRLVRDDDKRGVNGSPKLSSGILDQRNDTIALFALYIVEGKDDPAFVDDEGVVPLLTLDSSTTSTLRVAYRLPTSESPVTYEPQMTPHSWLGITEVLAGPPIPIPMRRSVASVAAVPPAPPVATEYGIQCSTAGTTYLTVLSQMPTVRHFRMGYNNSASVETLASDINALSAIGVKTLINLKNKTGGGLSVAVTDPTAYKNGIKALLTRFIGQISWITCENEMNTGNNYTQYISPGVPATDPQKLDRANAATIANTTATILLAQMTLCADAVAEWNAANPNATPVKASAGGFSSSGVKFARWYSLWTRGHRQKADAYARIVFSGGNEEGVKLSDIPDSANPGRIILGANPKAWLNLLQYNALTAGMRFTTMPYASVHLIPREDTYMVSIDATRWAIRALGMPCISDAVGSKDGSPLTAAGIAGLAKQLRLPFLSCFFGAGDNAEGFFDTTTGLLNAAGQVYNAVISGHPEDIKDIVP